MIDAAKPPQDGKYPQLLADLATHVAKFLEERLGIPQTDAEAAGFNTAEHVRELWGGQMLYIPEGVSFETRKRYEEIWGKFDGKNVSELAVEYGLSVQQLYKIIRIMRAESVRKNQHKLFDGDGT